MPHIFSLDGGEVDVLSEIVLIIANTEWLDLLALFKALGDSPLNEEGLDFNLLLDLLLSLVVQSLNGVLDLLWLDWFLV